MIRKRLTRREILQSSWVEVALSNIYDWGSKHNRLLIASLGAALLAIVGAYWWQDSQKRQAREIQISFADALEIYHAPVGKEIEDNQEGFGISEHRFSTDDERLDNALKAFQTIVDHAPSANISILAQYYTALLLKERGQGEKAKVILSSVILKSEQPEIRNMARNSLAQILEVENHPGTASELLEEILEDATPSFPEEPILFRLAQNQELANNTDEALKFYRKLLADYPSSGYTEEAQERIQQLEEKAELVFQD